MKWKAIKISVYSVNWVKNKLLQTAKDIPPYEFIL